MTGPELQQVPSPAALRPALEISRADWLTWLEKHAQPPMRIAQIRRWILTGRAESFDQMTDLSLELRQALKSEFTPIGARIARHQQASDGTHKLLLQLLDGQLIECVLIQDGDRRTVCISTQVGCGMGCVFCASGLAGVARNLTTAEILEQLVIVQNILSTEQRLTHIVVMGMGEPLANLENLLAALEVATAKDGLGLSARHITISTVGLPGRIRQLADLGKQYHLAVSLHAPNDTLRTTIVPTNPKTGLTDIMSAADYFFERTGRQVTYEYVLLRDLNDASAHARALARLLRGRRAHVNIIPFNDVEGLPYRRPTSEALTEFTDILRQAGISVKVRKRKGSEIDAACGQLRRSALASPPKGGTLNSLTL